MKKIQEKHGMSKHPLYSVRKGMISRTTNPNYEHFSEYGGRGIKVCKEWMEKPSSFFNWALSNGYKRGLSIDRIDVNGNYCPENCRWVTQKEQTRNTRRNNNLTFKDETKCIQDWAKKLGFARSSGIRCRLKRGWTLEKALSVPAGETKEHNYFLLNGERVTLAELGRKTGFKTFNYYARRKRGWTEIKNIFKEVDFNKFKIERID